MVGGALHLTSWNQFMGELKRFILVVSDHMLVWYKCTQDVLQTCKHKHFFVSLPTLVIHGEIPFNDVMISVSHLLSYFTAGNETGK